MSKVTTKKRIGNYFFNRYLVPMIKKDGTVERYKTGKIRLRHVKNFDEFMKNKKNHTLIKH